MFPFVFARMNNNLPQGRKQLEDSGGCIRITLLSILHEMTFYTGFATRRCGTWPRSENAHARDSPKPDTITTARARRSTAMDTIEPSSSGNTIKRYEKRTVGICVNSKVLFIINSFLNLPSLANSQTNLINLLSTLHIKDTNFTKPWG